MKNKIIENKFDECYKEFIKNYYKLTEQEKFICNKFFEYGVNFGKNVSIKNFENIVEEIK